MSQPMDGDNFVADFFHASILLMLLVFGIIWYYNTNAGPINYVLTEFNRAQLWIFAKVPGSFGDKAAYFWVEFGNLDPWELSFSHMVDMFAILGRFQAWFVIPIIGGCIYWGFTTKQLVSDYYRRTLTMKTLLKNNVHEYPFLAPIANRKKSILNEPYDTGKWRTPRMPIQFVAENNLIKGKNGKPVAYKHLIDKNGLPNLRSPIIKKNNNQDLYLDKEKAKELFMAQVGPKYNGTDELPDYIKGLVAVFMAIGAGHKKDGFKLLDHMATTFVEPENEGDDFKICIKGPGRVLKRYSADKLIQKYGQNDDLKHHTDHHKAYLYPFIMALFQDHAKGKVGVIPSSRYIWVRPVNHLLFNILNQTGGREPWTEGAGTWAHYAEENEAGQSLPTPEVDNAVKGLEDKMIKTGWIPVPKDWQEDG